MTSFHIHLVSDSTGETLEHVARACLVQFKEFNATEHVWNMIRSAEQVEQIINKINDNPGFVLYTLVNPRNSEILEKGCYLAHVPCLSVLDPIVESLGNYLGAERHARPGSQHVLDADYYLRIAAMQFSLTHDDGQLTENLEEADIVLLGVSRTSKTPTSIYLANRGFKTANVPIVPGCPIPVEVFNLKKPFVIGLIKDVKRLIEIRQQRLKILDQSENTDYVNIDVVSKEISDSRKLFSKYNWPIINVSRKSIEETAATIIKLYKIRKENPATIGISSND